MITLNYPQIMGGITFNYNSIEGAEIVAKTKVVFCREAIEVAKKYEITAALLGLSVSDIDALLTIPTFKEN